MNMTNWIPAFAGMTIIVVRNIAPYFAFEGHSHTIKLMFSKSAGIGRAIQL